MNKVILKNDDIKFLIQWKDEHKELVRMGVNPMKAVKILCVDSGYTITGIRNGSQLRLTVTEKGNSIGNMTFDMLSNGMCRLMSDKTKLNQENKQTVLTVYCSTMALLVFGNGTIDIPEEEDIPKEKLHTKSKNKPKKVKHNGVTYILNRSGKKPRIMVKGSHNSPSGTFSVRGHYRHYKNGKVVWISEYTKGSGKKKDKTYKVGLKGDNK